MPFLARHKSTGHLVTVFGITTQVWGDQTGAPFFVVSKDGLFEEVRVDNFESCTAWSSGEETLEMPQ